MKENAGKAVDTVLGFVLEGHTDEEIRAYCNEKLKPLIAADQKRNACYVQTLKAFLMCGNNLIDSAKVLYIHRNTMVQRMHKITELLGVAVNDPAVTNEYYNIFKVIEYLENR